MSDFDNRDEDGRFPPGRSGNPRGRPRKNKAPDEAVSNALDAKVTANINGKRLRLTKRDLTAHQIANKGASGNLRAAKMSFDFDAKGRALRAAAEPVDIPLTKSDAQIIERFLTDYRLSLGLEK